MNCLHPSISQRLTPLVIGITPERRRAVLSIAQQASCWQDFLDALKQGDFPLPPLPGKLTPLQPDHFFHQGA